MNLKITIDNSPRLDPPMVDEVSKYIDTHYYV